MQIVSPAVPTTFATSASVASSAAASFFGQAVTFSATVSSSSGTPGGIVTFLDGANVLGTAALDSNGIAQLTTSGLSVGGHSITASYAGNGTYESSASAALAQSVSRAVTTTAVSSSTSSTVFGQGVTFTASVSTIAPGAGVAGGAVTFYDGSALLGTVALNAQGLAVLSLSSLAVGAHSIRVTYGATTNHNGSTSTSISHTVSKVTTSTALSTSVNSAWTGQSIWFTVKVSSIAPGDGVPTGTVQFKINGTNLGGLVSLVNGTASSSAISSLSAGTHSITAVYNGSATHNTSTANLSQPVKAITNNHFTGRTLISGTSLTVNGANFNATKEWSEPRHAGNTGGRSVWWTWTAPSSGTLTLDTAGSSFNTLLAVYTGTGVSRLTAVKSNDNASSTINTSKLSFNAVAGRVYQVAVDGYNGAAGTITLKLTLASAASVSTTTTTSSNFLTTTTASSTRQLIDELT